MSRQMKIVQSRRTALCWACALLFSSCTKGSAPASPAAAASSAKAGVQSSAGPERMLLTGQVEAVSSLSLTVPRVSGFATLSIAWLAEDGAVVKRGDRIVELDASTFLGAIEDKRTAVSNAENELASQQAQSSLDRSTREFEVDKAKGELQKAELLAALPAELSPPREYQQRQLALAQARDQLTRAEDALLGQQRTAQLAQKIQEVSLARAQEELADLLRRVDQLTLTAPRDGLVAISRNEWEGRKYVVGDKTYPSAELAAMPELSAMQVRARLFDLDDGTVAEGMRVESVLDAYPRKVWRGHVHKVSPAARPASKDSPCRFFDVLVTFDHGAPELMRPGMSVRVEVLPPLLAGKGER